MILLDPKLCFWQNDIDYISGEFWQPPLVRCQKLSWRGFCTSPSFLFSFSSFRFYINLTLECYSTHTAGHRERVCGGDGLGWALKETLKLYLTHYLFLKLPWNPNPDFPVEAGQAKVVFACKSCQGLSFGLSVQQRGGSLWLFPSLARNSFTAMGRGELVKVLKINRVPFVNTHHRKG